MLAVVETHNAAIVAITWIFKYIERGLIKALWFAHHYFLWSYP
jgi:hypothetical protein